MTTRFTEKRLREEVAQINGHLREAGILWRLHWSPRNNYQAVDRYPITSNDADAYRGQGVYNVGCGTPREVADWCWAELNTLQRQEPAT